MWPLSEPSNLTSPGFSNSLAKWCKVVMYHSKVISNLYRFTWHNISCNTKDFNGIILPCRNVKLALRHSRSHAKDKCIEVPNSWTKVVFKLLVLVIQCCLCSKLSLRYNASILSYFVTEIPEEAKKAVVNQKAIAKIVKNGDEYTYTSIKLDGSTSTTTFKSGVEYEEISHGRTVS